jgi:hypothetical protein
MGGHTWLFMVQREFITWCKHVRRAIYLAPGLLISGETQKCDQYKSKYVRILGYNCKVLVVCVKQMGWYMRWRMGGINPFTSIANPSRLEPYIFVNSPYNCIIHIWLR